VSAVLWFLCARRNRLPIAQLREYAGREFRRLVRPLYHERLRRTPELPGGAYLFADIELLDPKPLERLRRIACRLREAKAPLLNDPAEALGRYALLRRLREDGVNDFDAYRLDEHRAPARWPVFVRGERDHKGAGPGLLPDAEALAARADPSKDLAVEFVDVRDADGWYRKYGACRVGDRVFARHIFFDRSWMVKMNGEAPPERLDEERRWVEEFPDRDEVEAIFRRANVEYGRIDYGRKDGRIQVWEINTNPAIVTPATRAQESRWELNREVIARQMDAMLAIAREARGRPPVSLRGVRGVRGRWWGGAGGR